MRTSQAIIARRRAAVTLAAAALIWLLPSRSPVLNGASRTRVADAAREPQPTSSRFDPRARFRLGTAARPFGWATATADLNADGRADFAIVDRVGSAAGLHRYAIDIALSGAPNQRFVLDSSYDAVTVVVEDIDADNDLDIVITPALTRDAVAVWVNDGYGGFRPAHGDVARRAQRRGVLSSVVAAERCVPAVASKRAVGVRWPAGGRIGEADEVCRRLADGHAAAYRLLLSSSDASRGPPDLLLL